MINNRTTYKPCVQLALSALVMSRASRRRPTAFSPFPPNTQRGLHESAYHKSWRGSELLQDGPMQIRDVSCRHVPSPTHHRTSHTPICCASVLRGQLHTSLWSLWIDPLAVTPSTLRLELGEGLHGIGRRGDHQRCALLSPDITPRYLLHR